MIYIYYFIILKNIIEYLNNMNILIILALATPYYYNHCIHNMGNSGPMGMIHASLAPLFTKIIDKKAYNGINIRKNIYSKFDSNNVLDLCCGTGFSTKPGTIGVDTSREMLKFANIYNPGSEYIYGNAENFGTTDIYDYVTCMFAFHEMPNKAHIKIIDNAIRIAKKKIVIVDISTSYTPSKLMLAGEPYILNYLDTIDSILSDFNKTTLISGHVDQWEFVKN